MREEKVYWKDIALMIYYFIFGTLIFITAIYGFDIMMVGLFTFGIFVWFIFTKYNINFNIKNIKKVWRKDKRQSKLRRLSERDLRRYYLDELYSSILMLFFLNILISYSLNSLVFYYEIYYIWFLYLPFLIYSIYFYKRTKKWIYLNE